MKPSVLVAGLIAAGLCGPLAVQAQMYHLYLDCKGHISAGENRKEADMQLAFRDNNMTVLFQRSNVLPVGEKAKYSASQSHYTVVYKTPLRGGRLVTDGYHRWMFTWYPAFERLTTTRLSIDRQTAELEGEMLDGNDELIGRMKMACQPMRQEDLPEPKF